MNNDENHQIIKAESSIIDRQDSKQQKLPELHWDSGTAYDFIVSLHVLHDPAGFGLRPSWAAGVRSRLSQENRKVLEASIHIVGIPFHWLYSLPNPKDAQSALWSLHQMPAEKRLPALTFYSGRDPVFIETLMGVAERGTWGEKEAEIVKQVFQAEHPGKKKTKYLEPLLDAWARSSEFGEQLLDALEAYYQSFFAEEERNIQPALEKELHNAKELAESLPLPDLFENLSQGVEFSEILHAPELIMIPSYWSSPIIFYGVVNENRKAVLFGARPANVSLVPGEVVPDAMLRVLKAVADPTRLRILRYLSEEKLTQAELARRLRLRAPTLTHHLRTLRLAGLVHLQVVSHSEQRYTARLEAIQGMFSSVEEFFHSDLVDPNES
jgi:DNA-binding transcriptional ArsR family regulator